MMKIYDISQELFGCAVFPGDPSPGREPVTPVPALSAAIADAGRRFRSSG